MSDLDKLVSLYAEAISKLRTAGAGHAEAAVLESAALSAERAVISMGAAEAAQLQAGVAERLAIAALR